jgi:hypothetical protein
MEPKEGEESLTFEATVRHRNLIYRTGLASLVALAKGV